MKAEDRKQGGILDEGGVSPLQVKKGYQREAGVEDPAERGLAWPGEGTQLPCQEGGGTWRGGDRLVGAGAADEGFALSLQRQGRRGRLRRRSPLPCGPASWLRTRLATSPEARLEILMTQGHCVEYPEGS